jgi:hypothetical protein
MAPANLRTVLAALKPGVRFMIQFVGDAEWHERICTGKGRTMVTSVSALTPDEDHYVHDLAVDAEKLELVGPRGGLPRTVRGGLVYRFDEDYEYDDDELERMYAEGERLLVGAGDVRAAAARRGRPPAGKGGAALPLADAAAAGAAGALGTPPLTPRGLWLLAEPLVGHDVGEDVSGLVVAHLIKGDSAWWRSVVLQSGPSAWSCGRR